MYISLIINSAWKELWHYHMHEKELAWLEPFLDDFIFIWCCQQLIYGDNEDLG